MEFEESIVALYANRTDILEGNRTLLFLGEFSNRRRVPTHPPPSDDKDNDADVQNNGADVADNADNEAAGLEDVSPEESRERSPLGRTVGSARAHSAARRLLTLEGSMVGTVQTELIATFLQFAPVMLDQGDAALLAKMVDVMRIITWDPAEGQSTSGQQFQLLKIVQSITFASEEVFPVGLRDSTFATMVLVVGQIHAMVLEQVGLRRARQCKRCCCSFALVALVASAALFAQVFRLRVEIFGVYR